MRLFVYLVLIAFALILFKAFYWDSHEVQMDQNNSEPIEVVEPASTIQAPTPVTNPENGENKTMPLDELGNDIAKKIDL